MTNETSRKVAALEIQNASLNCTHVINLKAKLECDFKQRRQRRTSVSEIWVHPIVTVFGLGRQKHSSFELRS